MTMVDIQGLEDFFGDMDFKVGGTKKGITAIQMDLKIHGLTPAIITRSVLTKTLQGKMLHSGRSHAAGYLRAAVKSFPSMLPRCSTIKIAGR